MGSYPDKVVQTRFGQRPHGVGIVWERPENVDVDHYEIFISSREIDQVQIEAFCRGEVDFAKRFTFDSNVHSVIDDKTPMFSRMLYSVYAVDKTGNYVNMLFTIDDSKNLNLKNPKKIAVEEGPWGIKGQKPIAVEEGPVGGGEGQVIKKMSVLREALLAAVKTATQLESPLQSYLCNPWVSICYLESSMGFDMEITSDIIMFKGDLVSPGPFRIRRFSYTLSENQISGYIMNDLPIYFLEKEYINGESFNIAVSSEGASKIQKVDLVYYGEELQTVLLEMPSMVIFYGCKISLISLNYDGNTCQRTYDFTAQKCLVKSFNEYAKEHAMFYKMHLKNLGCTF